MGKKVPKPVSPPGPVEDAITKPQKREVNYDDFKPLVTRLSADTNIIKEQAGLISTQGDKKCESRLQSIKLYSDSLSQNINFINGCITSYTDILKHK